MKPLEFELSCLFSRPFCGARTLSKENQEFRKTFLNEFKTVVADLRQHKLISRTVNRGAFVMVWPAIAAISQIAAFWQFSTLFKGGEMSKQRMQGGVMTEIPRGGDLSRMVQNFGRQMQHRFRPIFITALAVLAWWAWSPAPANATCNDAGRPKGTSQIDVASAAQPLGWLRGLTVEEKTSDDEGEPSVVGLWHVALLNPDGVTNFDEGFDLWHSDGTEEFNDNANPQPANGSGSVCFGVYKKTGSRTYKLRHPFWIIDSNGALSGSGVFLEEIILDPKGDAYTGTFEIKTFDLTGALTFDQKGALKAERLSVD